MSHLADEVSESKQRLMASVIAACREEGMQLLETHTYIYIYIYIYICLAGASREFDLRVRGQESSRE